LNGGRGPPGPLRTTAPEDSRLYWHAQGTYECPSRLLQPGNTSGLRVIHRHTVSRNSTRTEPSAKLYTHREIEKLIPIHDIINRQPCPILQGYYRPLL